MNYQKKIKSKFEYLTKFLLDKNKKYGDSALDPVRIFARAEKYEGLLVRLDDKISRLMRGQQELDHELVRDIIGYLVLYDIMLDENVIKKENKYIEPKKINDMKISIDFKADDFKDCEESIEVSSDINDYHGPGE